MFESTLASIGIIFFIFCLLAGLVLVPLGFPGTWLIFGATILYSLVTDFRLGTRDTWILGVVFVLALIAEALEFGIGVIGSKKLQVSNGALLCSIIGGLIGAVVGVPIMLVGSLLGLLLGVFLGAFVYEILTKKNFKQAFLSSLAAFFSRVVAIFVKTTIAFAMVIYLLMKMFGG